MLRLQRHLNDKPDDAIHPGAAKNIAGIAAQLLRSVRDDRNKPNDRDRIAFSAEAFSQALLAAYPDRLARRRRPGSDAGLMVGGRGVRLAKLTNVRSAELFVCVNVDGRGEDSQVRIASAIDPSWLSPQQCEVRRELFFHPSLNAVVARQRTYFQDLQLQESPPSASPAKRVPKYSSEHASRQLHKIVPGSDKTLDAFLSRWRFVSPVAPKIGLPPFHEERIREILREFCTTRTSFKELCSAPWLDYLRSQFTYEQMQAFETHAPDAMEVPSGNRIKLEYQADKSPILAVRIQGSMDGPRRHAWPGEPFRFSCTCSDRTIGRSKSPTTWQVFGTPPISRYEKNSNAVTPNIIGRMTRRPRKRHEMG